MSVPSIFSPWNQPIFGEASVWTSLMWASGISRRLRSAHSLSQPWTVNTAVVPSTLTSTIRTPPRLLAPPNTPLSCRLTRERAWYRAQTSFAWPVRCSAGFAALERSAAGSGGASLARHCPVNFPGPQSLPDNIYHFFQFANASRGHPVHAPEGPIVREADQEASRHGHRRHGEFSPTGE